jgi:heat shock protein HslJ
MKKPIFLFGYFLLFLLVISCNTNNTTEPNDQEFLNTVWHLESIEISNNETLIPPVDQMYSIKFLADSTFSGRNACNEIGGVYTLLANSKIKIEQLVTTKAYCPYGTIHDDYHGALDALRMTESKYGLNDYALKVHRFDRD